MQYYCADIIPMTYITSILAIKTTTIPIIAAETVLVAFSIFSASPAEVINIYPAIINIITAAKAENIIK